MKQSDQRVMSVVNYEWCLMTELTNYIHLLTGDSSVG